VRIPRGDASKYAQVVRKPATYLTQWADSSSADMTSSNRLFQSYTWPDARNGVYMLAALCYCRDLLKIWNYIFFHCQFTVFNFN